MSELGIATAASDKIVLAVISHMNEGNISDAVAMFADQFSFKDHGIQIEFQHKGTFDRIFSKGAGTLAGYALAHRHDLCERRPRAYRMDASNNFVGNLLSLMEQIGGWTQPSEEADDSAVSLLHAR